MTLRPDTSEDEAGETIHQGGNTGGEDGGGMDQPRRQLKLNLRYQGERVAGPGEESCEESHHEQR